ncbi:Inositol-1-monophosphatase [Arthrobotrys entomopaga]|nr:Inositol-1-monophosphatase [Arthrobotrys entomopaga]
MPDISPKRSTSTSIKIPVPFLILPILLGILVVIIAPTISSRIYTTIPTIFCSSTRITNLICSRLSVRTIMATSSAPYARERRIAELAVQRAAILTRAVYTSKVKGTVTKEDKSPVTLADFGAQSLVFAALHASFPDDNIIGEEDSSDLRSNPELTSLVFSAIQDALSSNEQGAAPSAELGSISNEKEMLEYIDKGDCKDSATGRVWALDPIDGTKGFLRGGQYAIALGLLVDGEVKVGVLGCPNLSAGDGEEGVILSAVRGQGAIVKPMSADLDSISDPKQISMNQVSSTAEASFCEGVEAGHSAQDLQAKIAQALGITAPSVRMDSQAKYAAIAMGQGEIYLRLPTKLTYEEKIWDHAAGSIIVEEAGGVLVDMYGDAIDFSTGRTFKKNKGFIAMPKSIAEDVKKVVGEFAVETYGRWKSSL